MKSYVVVEGKLDVDILSAVKRSVAPGIDVVFVDGKGKSNAVSLARSLLVARKCPVALVVDADTVNPNLVQEQRQGFESLLGLVAPRDLWAVVMFEPEIERCLFRDPGFTERLFGDPLSERDRVLAEYNPRRALYELAVGRWGVGDGKQAIHGELVRRLGLLDLKALAEDPAVKELLAFVQGVSARSAA